MIYKHGKHEIELYDSIHNLKILRFQRFNKYRMIASEVGNTFEDYDQRTSKALQFLQKKMYEEAAQELENRRQTVFNAYNEFSPIGKSFAILVKRIDQVRYENFSPDDLDRCLEHLDRINVDYETLTTKLSEVKKKIETELVVYYPQFFPKDGNQEHTALRVVRMNVMLDAIINNDVENEKVWRVERDILQHDKPNVWNVWKEGNMERVLEVDFQKFGISVTELSNQRIEDITTFTFYATVEHLKEKYKPKKG